MPGIGYAKSAGLPAPGFAGVRYKMSATSITFTWTPKTEYKPFRFLDLPRELRDKIYSFSTVYRTKKSCGGYQPYGGYFTFWSSATCRSNLLLVSKQVKQEYEKETYRDAEGTLSFKGPSCLPAWSDVVRYITLITRLYGSFKRLDVVIEDWFELFVEVAGTMYYGYTPAEFIKAIKTNLLPAVVQSFPQLQTLKVMLSTSRGGLEFLIDRDKFQPSTFLDADFASAIQGRQIALTQALCISDELFEINVDAFPDIVRATDAPTYPSNEIVYHATPATSEPSWRGLDLHPVACGTFDWKEICRCEADAFYDHMVDQFD